MGVGGVRVWVVGGDMAAGWAGSGQVGWLGPASWATDGPVGGEGGLFFFNF